MSSESSPTSVVMMSNMRMNMSTTNNNDKAAAEPQGTLFDENNPRSCILQVGVSAGRLCGVANSHMVTAKRGGGNNAATSNKNKNNNNNNNVVLVLAMSDLLQDLWKTSRSLDLNIILAIRSKLELNQKKYPVELCKGKAGKYTQYSKVTGVTQSNQSTHREEHQAIGMTEFRNAVPQVAAEIRDFSMARNWSQFHTPRNIVLALLGEVGELAELLQWKSDIDNDDDTDTDTEMDTDLFDKKERDKLSQELADVSIYLLRLATVCDVVGPLCDALQEAHPSSSSE